LYSSSDEEDSVEDDETDKRRKRRSFGRESAIIGGNGVSRSNGVDFLAVKADGNGRYP